MPPSVWYTSDIPMSTFPRSATAANMMQPGTKELPDTEPKTSEAKPDKSPVLDVTGPPSESAAATAKPQTSPHDRVSKKYDPVEVRNKLLRKPHLRKKKFDNPFNFTLSPETGQPLPTTEQLKGMDNHATNLENERLEHLKKVILLQPLVTRAEARLVMGDLSRKTKEQ